MRKVRKNAIENWLAAQSAGLRVLIETRREGAAVVSDSESLDALAAGIKCGNILAALAAIEEGFKPAPYYDRRSWFGDRGVNKGGFVRPGDEAMHRVAGDDAARLAEILLTVKWGQIGCCFVTNHRDGWSSDRILTLYINRRPRAVVYDRYDNTEVYFIPATSAEWIFAIEKRGRQAAEAAYAEALAEATAAVEAAFEGRDHTPWRYEPGQKGGTIDGPWGRVSARGANLPRMEGFDDLTSFGSAEVVAFVRCA